jgi:hypothetical protein
MHYGYGYGYGYGVGRAGRVSSRTPCDRAPPAVGAA